MLKRIVKSVLARSGYQLKKVAPKPTTQHNVQMLAGVQAAAKLPIDPATIVDVGAAAGTWTIAADEVWTNSKYLLFEPLHERKNELEELCSRNPRFDFISAAAGREKSELLFVVTDDLDGSGLASADTSGQKTRSVSVVRIDDEIEKRKFAGPYVIKLDTHGFEVPIIEGCSRIMEQIELFIIECYGFQVADNSLLFWEMCSYMKRYGFKLYRIVDVMNRPVDGAFWQCDAFFLREDNPVFSREGYN